MFSDKYIAFCRDRVSVGDGSEQRGGGVLMLVTKCALCLWVRLYISSTFFYVDVYFLPMCNNRYYHNYFDYVESWVGSDSNCVMLGNFNIPEVTSSLYNFIGVT